MYFSASEIKKVCCFGNGLIGGVWPVPVTLDNEIPSSVGNRLQFSVWKEVLYMMSEGVASAEKLDDAMVHDLALRWTGIESSQILFLRERKTC